MTVRIGIDLVCPDEVRESLSIHGERYLERIYTREERVDAAGDPARLAAVFAAKEATMKALLAGEQPVDWRSISVRRDPAGRASVRLTGTAHALARSAGVEALSVTLSHNRHLAAAVVVATKADGDDEGRGTR